jgi:hypothetical protein
VEAKTALLSIRQRIYRIPVDLTFSSKVKAVVESEMKRASQSLPRSEYRKLCDLLRPELNALVAGWKAVALARMSSLLKNPDRLMTKIVAHDLKRFSKIIGVAAEEGRKQFFIELGKVLSGKVKPEVWDRRDLTLAALDFANPSMTGNDLTHEMEKLGWRYTEETALRMQRHRLARDIDAAGKALRELAKQYGRRAKA